MAKARSAGVDKQLREAREATERGDFALALARLLAAWQRRPVAPIGDAIDEVGRAAAARQQQPTGKTPKERRAAWEALAERGDPVHTSLLLATAREEHLKATWERVVQLDGGDPRVAMFLVELVEAIAFHPGNETWQDVFSRLAVSPDPRIAARVRALPARWDENRTWNYHPLLDAEHARILPLVARRKAGEPTDDERALCAEIVAAIPPLAAPANEQALLDAIYAQPDDDGPRMVYMDWLLERGDPRGEFIGLQLARARGEEGNQRREDKLLAQHTTAWLGALADRIKPKSERFERGFLAECTLRDPLFELDEDPAWATLRVLHGGVPGSDRCRVPALRVLDGVDGRGVAKLARLRAPLAVEQLAWNGPLSWQAEPERPRFTEDGNSQLAELEQIRVLPNLRRLELRGHAWWSGPDRDTTEEIERVLRAPLAANLTELALPVVPGLLRPSLALAERSRLSRLDLCLGNAGSMWPQSIFAQFTRGAGGKFSRVSFLFTARYVTSCIHYAFGSDAVRALTALPASTLEYVELDLPRIAEMLAREQLAAPLSAAVARHPAASPARWTFR